MSGAGAPEFVTGAGVPEIKDLVLVGGGHSHVEVLRSFAMAPPPPGVRLNIVCRDIETPYSGMLPGFVAGHYRHDDIHIDLGPLARAAGARLLLGEVVGLDLEARRVLCQGRPPLPYDVLSINVGAAPAMVPGADGAVIPVKPVGGFVTRWRALRDRVLEAEGPPRIAVVGGGAGGVELVLAVEYRLGRLLAAAGRAADRVLCTLVTDGDDILPTHNGAVRRRLRRVMEARGIAILTGHRVVRAEPGRLVCAGGATLAMDEILWVTAAAAPAWPGGAGLAVDAGGFIRVDAGLRSLSHADVFAAGDIAAVDGHPRPKSGVFAVRQGPPLAANLRRALAGRPPAPYVPQRRFLSLITTGGRHAVVSRGGWSLAGAWAWRWKDRIDRRFMRRYTALPAMAPAGGRAGGRAEMTPEAMRCGGCGGKIGAAVLKRVLERLDPVTRDDVLIGLERPDDAAVVAVPAGKVMVHTVDSFRPFIDDPYVFGRIAANHALGDIFAMGAKPSTALAIVTVAPAPEDKMVDDVAQMLTGALEIFGAANTVLLGGHTGEASEPSLGFAINGLADAGAILRKDGMRPGDRLILTKALGTGALFAADMRAAARGRWITAALEAMEQSSGDAARCLAGHGATACTDVTGFGLLGHLVEMARPSGVDVEIELGAVPVLDGVMETMAAGIFSSLQPANARHGDAVRDWRGAVADARTQVLLDPQTAGGLLASVPGDRAMDCVDALRGLGYGRAAVIGSVRPSGNRAEPVTLRL